MDELAATVELVATVELDDETVASVVDADDPGTVDETVPDAVLEADDVETGSCCNTVETELEEVAGIVVTTELDATTSDVLVKAVVDVELVETGTVDGTVC
jgi:copper chaperone CopZ